MNKVGIVRIEDHVEELVGFERGLHVVRVWWALSRLRKRVVTFDSGVRSSNISMAFSTVSTIP